MKIKVLFFAQLRDASGSPERIFEVQEKITVGAFAQTLFDQPGFEDFQNLPMLYSVNEELVLKEQELQEEDTLGLLPPVSGG